MSRYIVRIVSPAGREMYLARGKRVESRDNATRYPHPSSAQRAMITHIKRYTFSVTTADVIDLRDPERKV